MRVIGSGLLRLEFIKTSVECPDVSNKRMKGRERAREGGREARNRREGRTEGKLLYWMFYENKALEVEAGRRF